MRYLGRQNTSKLITNNGNQLKTVEVIKHVVNESQEDNFIQNFVNLHKITPDLKGIEKLFNLIFFNTFFLADPEHTQFIRSPRRLFMDKCGNCVDYSTCIAAFCKYLKIPCQLVVIAADPKQPDNLNHIYCKVFFNLPLDLVIGQNQDGSERFKKMHERKNYFGHEVPNYQIKTFNI